MNFLAELKRRNVIRVALAYAVVAWFIVQAADVLLGNFGAPSWVFKTLTSLLALGFPLVLFLSWVYDLTPGGLQKTDDADAAGVAAPNIGRGIRVALMVGLVLLAGAAAWLTFRGDDVTQATPDTASRATTSPIKPTQPAAAPRGLRFSIPMPEGLEVGGPIAISRGGEQIAFQAADAGGEAHIYLRRLNDFEPKQVEGSRRGSVPFFSPDGSAVGFFTRGAIWRAATAGGPPTQLRAANSLVGADWMMDDTIVYSTGNGSALQRMSADGTVLDAMTTLDKSDFGHAWPQRIPGTDQLLFTLWRGGGVSWGGAQMLNIKTGSIHPLSGKPDVASPPARWSASGHLILENGFNGLFAYPFDPSQDQSAPLAGASFLLGGVDGSLQGTRAYFALSETGVIAYVPAVLPDRRLVRIQADGSTETILEQSALASQAVLLESNIAVSRDGRQVLIGAGNVALVDLARKLPRPLTSDTAVQRNNSGATFSPDEREVYFASNREESWKIWKVPIDGSAPPSVAAQHALGIAFFSIDPSGEIVFSVRDPATQSDIWLQDAAGTQRALIATQASEGNPALSPDGATLAYVSDASGSNEVYLIAASGKGVPVQVTDGGGSAPKWSLDGRALLFRKGRHVFQIAVKDGQPVGDAIQRFAVDNLFEGGTYALAPDGNSLYAVQLGAGSIPREIRVITDFFDEIERVTKAKNKP
jgi:hypothetical protein